ETVVFPFRFRRGSGAASRGLPRRAGGSARRTFKTKEEDFYYAAAHFQQQPDEASKRHCMQRSLVVVSQHGFLSFWAELALQVGRHFQQHGPEALGAASASGMSRGQAKGRRVDVGSDPRRKTQEDPSKFKRQSEPKVDLIGRKWPTWAHVELRGPKVGELSALVVDCVVLLCRS
ncbi:unnamed protein product, partial [Effrenium voratum]